MDGEENAERQRACQPGGNGKTGLLLKIEHSDLKLDVSDHPGHLSPLIPVSPRANGGSGDEPT